MSVYATTVTWTGGHRATCRAATAMRRTSAPPQLYGEAGLLTPEDAFVGAVNTCFQMMFLWAPSASSWGWSHRCVAEGQVKEFLDQTSIFEKVILRPEIVVSGADERRVRAALQSARRYSLIAESIKSAVIIEATITVQAGPARRAHHRAQGKLSTRKAEHRRRITMLSVKVLGPAALANCENVEKTVREVVREMALEATIEKVKERSGLCATPAVHAGVGDRREAGVRGTDPHEGGGHDVAGECAGA